MLSGRDLDTLVQYWLTNAQEKRATMAHLYEGKRYADALFFGHLVLECALKALVVQATRDHAPRTHNLPKLAAQTGAPFDDAALRLLTEANEFNQEGRYPDHKFSFYKLCTKSYADQYVQPIINLAEHVCRLARQKK